jgi:hypothetical protein
MVSADVSAPLALTEPLRVAPVPDTVVAADVVTVGAARVVNDRVDPFDEPSAFVAEVRK